MLSAHWLYEDQMEREKEKAPSWQRSATVLVFILATAAFAYVGYAWYAQRHFQRLMRELVSADREISAKAADELASTDGALPYLTDALINRTRPEDRAFSAELILRRVEARRSAHGPFANVEEENRYLRSVLNLEAITSALQDESSTVRARALEIIRKVGTEQNYQKHRLGTMLEFEKLLKKLASSEPAEQDATGEELRRAGIRALPYLVGVVFSEDSPFRLRGLKVLRTVVQDVLRGSNQRRIVPLLGRRRCELLLREMTRLDENDRPLVTDILNVSGRVKGDFFERLLKEYAAKGPEGRGELLADSIRKLEDEESLRGVLGPESGKIERYSGAAGGK
jgi:hypothetical protein